LPTCRFWLLQAAAVAALMSAGPLPAADWPTYRGGNARLGATTDALAVPLSLGWVDSAPAAPRTAWSGPGNRVIEGKELRHRDRHDDCFHVVVAGDRVYYGSSVDHRLYCRDAATGRALWTFVTGGPIRLAPTVDQGRIYFGSDDGFAYCLDAATGKPVWKLRAGGADEWILARGEMISRWPVRTGVLVDDGIAYFGAGIFPHENIYIYAVRAEDGTIVWKRDNISDENASRNDLSPQGYLLTGDEILLIPSGRSLPAALDRKTGEIRHKITPGWRSEAGGIIGGTSLLLADGQIYAGGDHHFMAYDEKTGAVGYGYFDARQIVIEGDDAYMAKDGKLSRVVRGQYAEASRERHKVSLEAQEIARDLFRAKEGADVDALRAKLDGLKQRINELEQTGLAWRTESSEILESALIKAGNLVVAGGSNLVAAFDADTGKEVWRTEVEGDARGFAAAAGRLYVSTTAGKVYSFGPSKGEPALLASAETDNPYQSDEWTDAYAKAAEQILERTKVRHGFCLVVGSEEGRLAYELARRSDLKIYGIEPDEEKVAKARQALTKAGLYGNRITIHHAEFSAIPYSNYFANLVVSDTLLVTGKFPGDAAAIARHVKPVGGVICLGRPAQSPGPAVEPAAANEWLAATKLAEQSVITDEGSWATLTRGALPGAGSWSHLYGDPGNTASSEDRLVKGGLGVLWYGDPGPGKMVNRHEGAVGPLAVNGRLFVQGTSSVMAYDAYNGEFLWERGDEGAQRTGVFLNYNPGNLAADNDNLYVMVESECLQLDAATGDVRATHTLPPELDPKKYDWGYLAVRDGLLFGTATVRKEIAERARRRGRVTEEATDALFAIDLATAKHAWTYHGKSISHHTIALGPGRVFFIDSSITADQRAELLRQDKTELQKLTAEEAKEAEERMKRLDARTAVGLDARTGQRLWGTAVDVTDCSEIGTGGGQLTLMHQNNVLVLCGANANGHYWKQFLEGEFKRRRLVALSAEDGHKLWAKDANYRHRPIIIEDRIIAEPWGFDLYTGTQQTREHPLTGQPVPWSMVRPGHHCGMLTGCPSMLLFRSGYTGYYNLEEDAGTQHFAGHRLGCWINAIPANGLVMIPEASQGCVCLFSIAATITLEPREARQPWAIFSAVGAKTPVKHMALNLGAPGDRRDARGTGWLAYPRPRTGKETGLDLEFDIQPQFLPGGGFVSQSEESAHVVGAETPWIFTSAARGLSECKLPLVGANEPAGIYTVRLYFADLENDEAGRRTFGVSLQGRTAVESLDIVAEAAGARRPLVREFPGIEVRDQLVISLAPHGDAGPESSTALPILSAIEVVRTGDAK